MNFYKIDYFPIFHILTPFLNYIKFPYAKFDDITSRSIQIAFKNFFWIEKILKIDGVMSILREGFSDILTD